MTPDDDDWESEETAERHYDISMLTCPYYWSDRIEGAMCRNGCWEEPACHTGGPFEFPPDWPAERCLARAVDRHVNEPAPSGANLDSEELSARIRRHKQKAAPWEAVEHPIYVTTPTIPPDMPQSEF